jgi:hypothetical protein
MKRLRLLFALLLFGLATLPSVSAAQTAVYHDRIAYLTVLQEKVSAVYDDDLESNALGGIDTGARRGDFLYTSDTTITQPAIVEGGEGGAALGGSPFDVFVGGDCVLLTYKPLAPGQPPRLLAFGADFLYAPSFDDISADTYRIGIADGTGAGQYAGNLEGLDGAGGTFFLGIIVDPTASFTQLALYSVHLDPDFLVPAYQVDNFAYAAVPEPGALTLCMVGGLVFAGRLMRRRR